MPSSFIRSAVVRLSLAALLLGVLAFCQPSGFAQEVKQPAPAKASSSAADDSTKPTNYSDEAVVIEKVRREFRFENDGTGSAIITARFRVQTQAGVQQLGQLVFAYNSANEKLDVAYVRVSQLDGSGVVTAPPENFQDLPSQIEREAPSYSDFRERHITVPALRPGEILEYQVKTTTVSALIPNQFWFEHSFSDNTITLSEELEINIPKDRAVKLKSKPGLEPVTTVAGDRKIQRWTHNFLKRASKEDQKKLDKRRAREDFMPDVQLTTFQSWEELGAWYAGLQRSQMEPTPELRSKVAELIKGKRTDSEKIAAIYDFVAQEYRYVSLSFGVGRFQPHAASELFAKKYGDCKDKHTLFSAMLKIAGFNAQPVLIGSVRKLDPDVPSPSNFDHVITAIMPPDAGQDKDKAQVAPAYWADTTTEIAPFGLLSYNIRKKQALLVSLTGPARLIQTPSSPPFNSEQRFVVEGELSDLGKLKGTVTGTLRGDYELYMRSVFRNVPENKWKELADYVLYSLGVGGEVSNVELKNLTDTHQPFGFQFTFSRPNVLDWAKKSSELPLPLPRVGLANPNDADDDDSKTEKTEKNTMSAVDPVKKTPKPIEMGGPFDLDLRLNVHLPPSFKSRAPVAVSLKRDYAYYQSSYKVDGQTLTAERSMNMRVRDLPAERRSDFLAFEHALRSDEAQKFFVESLSAGAVKPEIPNDIKVEELMDSARDAFQNQNFKLAEDLLSRASEKDPKQKQVWNMLGDARIGNREFAEAEQAYRKQIATDSFDQLAHLKLGFALRMQRKNDDSIAAFKEQLEINPLDAAAHASLAEIYQERKQYQQAADALEKAVSLQPENAFLRVNLGRAFLNLKRDKEALEAFDKSVELSPNPVLWNNIAYELASNGSHLDRAKQYAESALSQVTSALRNVSLEHLDLRDFGNVSALASYWDTLGWVFFKSGDTEKADKYLSAAWKLSHAGEVGDHMGQLSEKKGSKDDAIRYYAEALSAERPVPDTRGRLERVVGDKANLKDLEDKYRSYAERERTFKLANSTGKSGVADFFVLLAPGQKVESVRFVSGAAEVKPLADKLTALDYKFTFPDDTPTKVVRRGTAKCSADECSFVLMVPETITSIN